MTTMQSAPFTFKLPVNYPKSMVGPPATDRPWQPVTSPNGIHTDSHNVSNTNQKVEGEATALRAEECSDSPDETAGSRLDVPSLPGHADALHKDGSPPPLPEESTTSAPEAQLNLLSHERDDMYFNDRSVFFRVENKLFKVPSYFFERDSTYMRTLLAEHGQSSESHPIDLEQITAVDLRRFLGMLYPIRFDKHSATTMEEWVSILVLSTTWGFKSIRTVAIRELVPLTSPVKKIALGRKYDINHWLKDAYHAVCACPEALSMEEAELLGLQESVNISKVRQDLRVGATLVDGLVRDSFVDYYLLKKSDSKMPPVIKPVVKPSNIATGPSEDPKADPSPAQGFLSSCPPLPPFTTSKETANAATNDLASNPDLAGPSRTSSGTTSRTSTSTPGVHPFIAGKTALDAAGALFSAPSAPSSFFPAPPTQSVPPVKNGSGYPFSCFSEKNPANPSITLQYNVISCLPHYRGTSFEELRVQDYAQGRKAATIFRA